MTQSYPRPSLIGGRTWAEWLDYLTSLDNEAEHMWAMVQSNHATETQAKMASHRRDAAWRRFATSLDETPQP